MVGFGVSGGETSGSSSRKPFIYQDGQVGNEIQRKSGGWNWLRIMPKWWTFVSAVVKLLVLVPENHLFTRTDRWGTRYSGREVDGTGSESCLNCGLLNQRW
jgi:hypothetical protein